MFWRLAPSDFNRGWVLGKHAGSPDDGRAVTGAEINDRPRAAVISPG
jgi:hypothetical protein